MLIALNLGVAKIIIKGIIAPEIGSKSFGTFGKQAPGYQKFCFTFH